MKKIIIIVLCLNATIVLGQTKGDGLLKALNILNDGINSYNKAKNGAPSSSNRNLSSQDGNWGSWVQNDCYKGLYFRIQKKKYIQGKWQLSIQVKSSYSSKVNYSHNIVSSDIQNGEHNIGRMYVDAYHDPSENESFLIRSNDNIITVEILNVCFGDYDECCKYSDCKKCFALPDNGTPITPDDCTNRSTKKCVMTLYVL